MADKHIVVSFGRSAGITKGHQKVFEKVHSLAKQYNGTGHIHLSKSFDAKKNPLHHDDKIKLAKNMMPHLAHHFESESKVKTPFHMMAHHSDPNATIHVVAGGDRKKEYEEKFNKYNGKDFHFKKIVVHNAGERNDGVSGTHLRNLATSGNFNEFKKHVPTTAKEHHAKDMYNKIRNKMMAEDYQKTIGSFLLEGYFNEEDKTEKKRILKLNKNKIMINPDFDKYQMRTHKNPDVKTPYDDINSKGEKDPSAVDGMASASGVVATA